MERIVEEMKRNYPEKYKQAQSFGEDIMSKDYQIKNDDQGKDTLGEIKMFQQLLKTIKEYNLSKEDLTTDEQLLLEKFKNL